jgi:cytoskeleton protein RodZ
MGRSGKRLRATQRLQMSNSSRQNSRQPPWEAGVEADVTSFGTWLRQQRELREVSLREVADVTKISIRYLEALEQDRFDVLPAPVFAKGFLRQYASYVGLKPDDVVNSYLNALQEQEPNEEEPQRTESRKTSWEWASGLLLALLVVALLALVAFLAFYAERRRSGVDEQPPPIAAPPVEVVPELPGVVNTAGVEQQIPLLVTMDFTDDCWVEAVVDDGRRLSELHVQGESLRIEADRVVRLTLGDPSAVRVEVNGEPYDMPEAEEEVVSRLEISVDDFQPAGQDEE